MKRAMLLPQYSNASQFPTSGVVTVSLDKTTNCWPPQAARRITTLLLLRARSPRRPATTTEQRTILQKIFGGAPAVAAAVNQPAV